MSVFNIRDIQKFVYIILGIDAHEHDQVIAVCQTYDEAKRYCIKCLAGEFYDVWIEKHPVI